jgi:hypothetical protein
MRNRDVELGAYYAIAHTSYNRLSVIRLDSVCTYGGWNATKLSTGRRIRIRSAAKLRMRVVRTATGWVRA